MANRERRATPTLPADCARMIAQYPSPDATGNPPANLPSNLRSRYSTCMLLWRAFNVRAGRAPTDGGTGTTTSTTTSTSTTGTTTISSQCAALFARYGIQNENPPGLPQADGARYSICTLQWQTANIRAGRDPMDGGTGTSTTGTSTSSTTTRTPRKKYVGPRAVTPGLMPRKKFQPSGGKKKQAVSKTAPEGASEGTNWKLIGLGVAVLALVGGGYWWSQQDDEDDAE